MYIFLFLLNTIIHIKYTTKETVSETKNILVMIINITRVANYMLRFN